MVGRSLFSSPALPSHPSHALPSFSLLPMSISFPSPLLPFPPSRVFLSSRLSKVMQINLTYEQNVLFGTRLPNCSEYLKHCPTSRVFPHSPNLIWHSLISTSARHMWTRRLCCHKETARCRRCSFRFKARRRIRYSLRVAKHRKPRFRAPKLPAQNRI